MSGAAFHFFVRTSAAGMFDVYSITGGTADKMGLVSINTDNSAGSPANATRGKVTSDKITVKTAGTQVSVFCDGSNYYCFAFGSTANTVTLVDS